MLVRITGWKEHGDGDSSSRNRSGKEQLEERDHERMERDKFCELAAEERKKRESLQYYFNPR
jgi:hypothetical protein